MSRSENIEQFVFDQQDVGAGGGMSSGKTDPSAPPRSEDHGPKALPPSDWQAPDGDKQGLYPNYSIQIILSEQR